MWLGFLWSEGHETYGVDAVPVKSLEDGLRKIKTINRKILTFWIYEFDEKGHKNVIYHDYLVGRPVRSVACHSAGADQRIVTAG